MARATTITLHVPLYLVSNGALTPSIQSGLISQASSSTARMRRSARDVHQPRPLAVVQAAAVVVSVVDMEAPVDEVSNFSLILCIESLQKIC